MKKSELHPSVRPGTGQGDPLEDLFDQARGEGLGAGEMSALWARVSAASLGGAAAPQGGSGSAAGGASTAATAAGASLKTVAVLLVGGGVLAAAAAGSHFWQASPSAHAAPVSASVPALAAAPAQAGPAAPAPISRQSDPSPGAVDVSALPSASGRSRASAKPRTTIAADPRDPARPLAAQRTPEPEASEGAGAPESATPQSGVSAGTPRVAAPAQGARSQQDDTTTTTNPAPPAAEPAPSEAALLLRARRALGSDPAGALALTDEHARRYPSGTLVPEREVLAIEALARLGRSSEARRRLDALRERFPNAANVSRLDGLIGK